MPPKRKIVEDESSVEGSSGLSSPLSQEDLELEAEEQRPTAAKKRRVGETGGLISGRAARPSRGKTIKKEVKDEDDEEEVKPTPKRQPRNRVAVKEEEEEEAAAEEAEDLKPALKRQPQKKKAAVK